MGYSSGRRYAVQAPLLEIGGPGTSKVRKSDGDIIHRSLNQ
jgi:hypothetical protein